MATKFLDYTGLSYLWNKIKTYAGNFACTAAKALGIPFVIPNETEQTATLTATITGITSYFVGLTVALRMPFNTPASATLNINNLGAKPIYYKVNTTSANYYPADTVVLLVYETTTLSTGCFKMVYAYDSNTNNATAQNISTNNNTFPVLIGYTANATANIGNKATYFCKDVKINPSTGILSANGFVGDITGDVTGNATTVTGTAGTSALSWNTETTVYTVGGHAIKIKLPANPNTNTDTLMTQNVSTTNSTYPILAVATANATANLGAKTGIFGSGVKLNPSTSEIIATKFTGNASTATKLATARSLKVALDSTTAVTFDGSAAQNAIPVTGILPVTNGGTGHGAQLIETTASDFNDYITTGDYHVRYTTSTLNWPYDPTNASSNIYDCILIVKKIGATSNVSSVSRYEQIAIVNRQTMTLRPLVFIRKGYSDGDWTSWSQIAYIDDDITGNAATATKLGTSNVGARDNPIYLSAGVPTVTGGTLAKTIQVGVGASSFSDMLQTLQSDNNNYRSCTIRCENGDGYNKMTLGAHDEANGGPSGITIKNTAGTVNVYAQNPASDSNDASIATTKWVNDILAYYPYKSSSNSTNRWSYYNIRDDIESGFDQFTVLGCYQVCFNATTKNSPITGVWGTYTGTDNCDGVLIVDIVSSAAHVSSNTRVRQTFRRTGYIGSTTMPSIYTRTGTYSGGQWNFNPWYYVYGATPIADKYGGRDFNQTGECYFACDHTDTGAYIGLYGQNRSSYAGQVRAIARKNSATKTLILDSDGTFTWDGQTIQTSSDERLKTPIAEVSSNILDAWENIQWGEFKFIDAVKKKGENARYHIGLIAQSVDKVFKEVDQNILKYGILCYEKHDATEDKYDDEGNLIEKGESAVDLWMVRYTEALCMEAAYQRRKNKILEDRISELEKRLAKLEGIM